MPFLLIMKQYLPLSLYIHIPWCVQKCPYCDFNSHQQKGEIPEKEYIMHLLADLDADLDRYAHAINGRSLASIFIGGGTPSLFKPENIGYLLSEVAKKISFSKDIEITMEANPGTVEANNFSNFTQAGITRISMGIQSFADDKLIQLGRIHNGQQAKQAIMLAHNLWGNTLQSFNLDLMHGLPTQSLQQALEDLKQAIALNPPHLSWYQLTIEPNTAFASRPPILPDDDELWAIFEEGDKLLKAAGYEQYETSAYAKPGFQCQHNLNYWRFGDYLAIGCGAHGKISDISNEKIGNIIRFSKTKHPRGYLQGNYRYEERIIPQDELAFEFFMNRFRLLEPVPKAEFEAFTGLKCQDVEPQINIALEKGFITAPPHHWQITQKGKLFLNELLTLFLD